MSLDLYIAIGLGLTFTLLLIHMVVLVFYVRYICVTKNPLAKNFRVFGMKTWLIYDEDFGYDIGFTLFLNAFMIPIIFIVCIFLWLPTIAVCLPWYIVYNQRKKLLNS